MKLINEIQFIKIDDDKIVMLNLINAAADILDLETYNKLINNIESLDENILNELKERKYIFDSKEEYNKYLSELNKKIEDAEKNSPPCFLVVPTYNCNLRCTYCYERTYKIDNIKEENLLQIVDRQFNIIDNIVEQYKSKNSKFYNSKDIRITIMGGEPLLKVNKHVIEYIFDKINKRNYSVDIITNGVDLDSFVELLSQECLDHIQITLDGSKEIHDKRRIYANGKGSFEEIIKNIDIALKNNIKIFLRVNVDNENLHNLPELANILVDNFGNKRNLKPYIYLLQDGGCSGDANVVKEEVGIEEVYKLEHKYPQMKIFRKKFHPEMFINSIFQNTEFRPSLRHCGASISQYILDYKGNIYRCWHGIGNDNYSTGKYIPDLKQDEEKNKKWNNRSILNLEKCIKCNYRYICGTGCPAATHKGENEFDIEKESCVDYKNLIETIIKEKIK